MWCKEKNFYFFLMNWGGHLVHDGGSYTNIYSMSVSRNRARLSQKLSHISVWIREV
jgi:hypothetical protein